MTNSAQETTVARDRLARLGEWLIQKRWGVLAVWWILISAGFYLAPKVDSILQGGTLIPGCESGEVQEILHNNFGNRFGHEMVLVFYNKDHLAEAPEFRRAVERIQLALRDLNQINRIITYYDTGSSNLRSQDGRTVLGLVELDVPNSFAAQRATPLIRERIKRSGNPGWLHVYVTGQGATYFDMIQASEHDALWAEAQAFPLVTIILIFTFGALLAAGIPVVLGLAAVTVTLGLIFLAGAHWPVFVLAKNAVTMIGLGVGIDYSQFMVSRFREELKNGLDARQAVITVMATAGKTVLYSGMTVIIGLSSIFMFNLPFLTSMAGAAVAVVLVAVAAALTLLPVLFFWIGPAIHWPRVVGKKIDGFKGECFWRAVALRIMKYPVFFFLITFTLLLALAYPLRNVKTDTLTVAGLPLGVESRLGFERLQTDFAAGVAAPVEIVIGTAASKIVWSDETVTRFFKLSRLLASDRRVYKVESIVDINPVLTLADYRKLYVTAGGIGGSANILAQMVKAYIAEGDWGGQTLMRVTLRTEPGSPASREIVNQIRQRWAPQIFKGSAYQVLVGGSTALQVDLDRRLMAKLPLIIGIVSFVTFLVLVVLFHSILIPLKSVFMNILSVLASFGILTLVFQNEALTHFWGLQSSGGISSIILVMLFAVLFGLSMDYEIFLTLRIKEEHDAGYGNEESVARGLAKTGGLVTSAAMIMVVVFGAFAFTRMLMTQQFGLGLAAAVFLDATVIRVLLMPATMRLLGEWNWWFPKRLERVLPRIGGRS